MDKLRLAATQALEALENFARFQRMMMDGSDASDKLLAEDYAEAAFLQGAQAIPALRAALAEQPAEQEPVAAWENKYGMKEWEVHALRAGWMPASPQPHKRLTDEEIKAFAMEAFDSWWDADDETLVNKYGHGVYLSRFVDFARAVIEAYKAKQGEQT